MERRGFSKKFQAIFRLWYWHLLLKRVSEGFIGTYKGMRFFYDTKSDGCALTYILEDLEFPVLWWVEHCVDENDVFIDIGSNIGNYSLLAAKKNASVFAFEPNQEVLSIQKIQLLLNSFHNVNLYQQAVGNKDGSTTFFLEDLGMSGASSIEQKSVTAHKVNIPMITLDSFVREQKIKHIRLIKIDAEGAEMLIFEGMKKTLSSQKVDYIIWEVTNLEANVLEKTLISLKKGGYSTEILKKQQPATTALTYKSQDKNIKRWLRNYYEAFEKGTIN